MKIASQRIATYENTHLWKFPPLKIPPSEDPPPPLKIAPKKITPRKLTPRKLSSMKVATIVTRNWKLLPCSPYVIMKNKAWWPVWWSWVLWKYRYIFNLTWIVLFFLMSKIHNYLMITLQPFVLFVTSKTQTECFVGKSQIDNFGALFCQKWRSTEYGNWIVFFFKEKITLKHLKIVRSPNPRVRLEK